MCSDLPLKMPIIANFTRTGIELVHMMRKQQGIFASPKALSLKQQFTTPAAQPRPKFSGAP
jgi:putative transposase